MAHVFCLRTNCQICKTGAICISAEADLLEAPVFHVASKFHVVVNGVVDSFNSVSVVDSKFWIEWRLGRFVDDTVSDLE